MPHQPPASAGRPRASPWTVLVAVLLALAVIGGIGYQARRWFITRFPYGLGVNAYRDDKLMQLALSQYALSHDGHYPAGGATPEASLCRLYPEYAGNEFLRSTRLGPDAVQALQGGGLLPTGAACRWHYVPGLTLSDDPEIALLWEEQPAADGSRTVLYHWLGDSKQVPAADWPAFIARQDKLRAARDDDAKRARPMLVAKVRLASGQVVDRFNGPFTLSHTVRGLPAPKLSGQPGTRQISTAIVSGGGQTASGTVLSPEVLRWYRRDEVLRDGLYTFTLTLAGMTSRPVHVEVRDGQASPREILLDLRPPPAAGEADEPDKREPPPARDTRPGTPTRPGPGARSKG